MWGIRVRRSTSDRWTRGRQFRRRPGTRTRWMFWRDEWTTREQARHVLRRYKAQGWRGHVFQIVSYPNKTHYSEHFTRAELNCKGTTAPGDCGCGGKNPSADIQRQLVRLAADLETMRAGLGGSLGVISAYRCPVHNSFVNGASQSQHMTGRAADLAVPGGQQDRYVAAANRVPSFRGGGIGVYPHGGVHVDRRGWVARWNNWVGNRR